MTLTLTLTATVCGQSSPVHYWGLGEGIIVSVVDKRKDLKINEMKDMIELT